MKKHEGRTKVQEAGLSVISSLVHDPFVQEAILAEELSQCIEVVIAVTRRQKDFRVDMLRMGCSSLASLPTSCGDAIVQNGGIEVMLCVIEEWFQEEQLTTNAFITLDNLSGHEEFRRRIKWRLDAIQHAMDEHKGCPRIQELGQRLQSSSR
eukprot:CAMPEP_0116864874 /NCGR_PEP_ID=MMETSP0418-20121206/25067_1 /TAXON_ID=1158023 /ORGANISM="Astrosyne radiata, Strain 13vi08-1A" /LENGTH=151 /DNA_ID=CAMNT_0004500149 /DNA_START=48 /DNA_END=503 /DNA_ORIENTATION=+